MVDDVLIFDQTQEEHDVRLETALDRIGHAGIALNVENCAFSQSSVHFLGQIVDTAGIRADPDKLKAIQNLSNRPQSLNSGGL